MKKIKFFKYINTMLLCVMLTCFFSCDDDETNTDPLASFDVPACIEEGVAVTFTNTSADKEDNISSYAWDFGDGESESTEESPSHTFVESGTYTITLVVTDEQGLSNTKVVSVTVEEVCNNTAPNADFEANSDFGGVGETFAFTDESSDDESNISTYEWDFGDDTESSEQSPTHSYSSPGVYEVLLKVTDEGGLTSEKTLNVIVWGDKWVNNIGTKIGPGAPAIAEDGTIYIGSLDFKLYAFNQDGTTKWTFTAVDAIRSAVSIGDDGTIYVASLDDNLYALNTDGTQKWAFTTGANIFYSNPAISDDGSTIYIGSDDFNLYAINASDGTEKWAFTAGAQVRSSPTIGTDGTVYIGTNEGKLHAIDPADGSEKWAFTADDKIEASAAIGSDGTIYFGSGDAKFYALNSDGTKKWEFSTVDTNPITGSAVIDEDGNIYFGTKKGETTGSVFYCLNSSGSENWKVNFDLDESYGSPEILSTPVLGADGTSYIPVSTGYLYAFNSDGSEKFKKAVNTDDESDLWDQAMWSSPALGDDGILYYGDYAGNFYAVLVSDQGLASSDWPMKSQNNRHTGLAK